MRKTFYTLVLSGCVSACSIFGSWHKDVTIMASEPDAEIYTNGELIGKGSVTKSFFRKDDISIMVKKSGFATKEEYINVKLSPLGMIDVLGGCILFLPFFGLLMPGAWEPMESNVTVVLEK